MWRESTPADFCFAAKGSRFITHMKKLADPELAIAQFFERVDRLGRSSARSCFSCRRGGR